MTSIFDARHGFSVPAANIAAGEEHVAILRARIDGDGDRAAERMAEHICYARQRVLAALFGSAETASERQTAASVLQD